MVWTKVFYQDYNLPILADPEQYIQAFDQARLAKSPSWLLPWLPGHAQHFWQYYLKQAAPDNFEHITSTNARAFFVPLRIPPTAEVVARDGTQATLEGFCFPYSAAVAATIRLRPRQPLSFADTAALAIAARNADYNLTWKDKSPATHGTLQSLADKIVSRVHSLARIPLDAVGTPLSNPITIATVIDADGEDNTDPAIFGNMLRALLALRSDWQTVEFKTSDTSAADPHERQLLPEDRGRAVWIPKNFSAALKKGRRTTNGCYHRNLTLAAMQTAALTALIVRAQEVLADPKRMLLEISPGDVSQAVTLLNDLSKGEQTTYRSWSLAHQIGFHADDINGVAAQLG
jgi:hypothetical protein